MIGSYLQSNHRKNVQNISTVQNKNMILQYNSWMSFPTFRFDCSPMSLSCGIIRLQLVVVPLRCFMWLLRFKPPSFKGVGSKITIVQQIYVCINRTNKVLNYYEFDYRLSGPEL